MLTASAPSEKKPSLYLFYGDDGFGMAKSVQSLVEKLGEPNIAELNLTRLDHNTRLEQLRSAAYAMPFLSERRLVVVSPALNLVKSAKNNENLLAFLEKLPDSTGLVLVIETEFEKNDWKEFKKDHWLRKWANTQPSGKVYSREFSLPKQHEMQNWIIEETRRQKGKILPNAALELANLVGSNPQLATQEITKILTYLNFSREIEMDDVIQLVADVAPTNIFDMVDALAEGKKQKALELMHAILQERADEVFGMVVRQFRLLIMTRTLIDMGIRGDRIAAELHVHPYVGKKLEKQAQLFSKSQLEMIYPQLLKIDENLKSSQMDIPLAMDLFISDLLVN